MVSDTQSSPKHTTDESVSGIPSTSQLLEADSSLGHTTKSSRHPSSSSAAKKHLLNIVVLSIAFLFNYTAFSALQNLQSSLNATSGVASLAVIYGSLTLFSLFAPALIRITGTKWTIAIGLACFSVYTGCNFHPALYTLIPGGFLLGFAASSLWTAQATYLTTSAISYADLKNEVPETIINQFNGIFFFFFQASQITGNLVASLVLYPNSNSSVHSLVNTTHCGVNSCGSSDASHPLNNTESPLDPSDNSSPNSTTVTLLMCVYLACGVTSFLIVCFLLGKLQSSQGGVVETTRTSLGATLRLFFTLDILLLMPLFMYSGMEQAFIFADFTKAFITCTSGIHYVGFVMMSFGISDAIWSFTFGRLQKYSGRILLFTAGGFAQLTMMVIMIFIWTPGDALWDRFLIAVVWGFGDAVWQTQLLSLVGVIYPEKQTAAFSCFRFGQSLGFCIYFAMSTVGAVCVIHKIIFLAGTLSFGLGFYYILEWRIRRVSRHDVLSNTEINS